MARYLGSAPLVLGVAVVLLASVACAPATDAPAPADPPAKAPSGPRFVIYYNSDATPLAAAADTSYTHVIVSFLRAGLADDGTIRLLLPAKMQGQWDAVETIRATGKRVLISFGGGEMHADDYAPLVGHEQDLAAAVAGFVQQRGLDGVDIDFEASEMFHLERPAGVGDGRAFLIALTEHLRDRLPAPRYELTHAPQPPYLNHEWHGGPYLDVLRATGDAVDWIAVQYYNNPGYDEPVDERIVGDDQRAWPTSYRSLVHPDGRLGWASRRVLVGKPVYRGETGSGLLSPDQIVGEIIEPLCAVYGDEFGGLAGWEFSTGTADHRRWNQDLPRELSAAACRRGTNQ